MSDKLAKTSFNALVQVEGGRTVAEMIAMNTGGQGMSESDIQRLKIPAGGGLAWEVPTVTGEDIVKDLECVVLAFNDHRVYYEGEYDGSNNPPNCSSKNLHTGRWVTNYDPEAQDDFEYELRDCFHCPMNRWGSAAKGRGKACSERRLMLVLTPGRALPFLIDIPSGSIAPVRQYFNQLTGESKVFFELVTNLKLERAESGGKIVYSQVRPFFVRDLNDEEMVGAMDMREALLPTLAVEVEKPIEGPL